MQGRSPLSSHLAGTVHLLEDFFGQDAIMADPPVGLEADLPQAGQVVDSLADIEILGAIDRGLGSQGSAFFVVLLDTCPFVVHVQGRNHALGNHPGSEQSGRTFGDPAVEDPLHLLGPADVQVFPNHFFEEDATGQRSVENLGEGKFDLENGELITIPGLTVARGERVRQETKPLAEEGLALGAGEPVAEGLQASRIGTRQDAIVEGLVSDTLLFPLALHVLVPVQAEFGVVRKVGKELQEEGAEVAVHTVEIVMIHQSRGLNDAGIDLSGAGIAASLGAIDLALLPCALPTKTTPSGSEKLARNRAATSSWRCPFSNVTRGRARSRMKFSMAATKRRVMGSTMRVEGTG